jgi:hypothetical protein
MRNLICDIISALAGKARGGLLFTAVAAAGKSGEYYYSHLLLLMEQHYVADLPNDLLWVSLHSSILTTIYFLPPLSHHLKGHILLQHKSHAFVHFHVVAHLLLTPKSLLPPLFAYHSIQLLMLQKWP